MRLSFPAAAFKPFFDKRVAVHITRDGIARKGTVAASVFGEGRPDPILDADAESSAESFTLLVRRKDWLASFPSPPQQGDRFTSPDTGNAYALTSVQTFDGDFVISARLAK